MGHFDRRSAILGNLDYRNLKGLEIGPLHNPLVRKSDGFILYVDHADTEFIKKVNRNPQFNNDDIVDIDIVWGDRPLKDLVPHPMDYVLASHVIEHVPDMIGWLMDLHGALTEDGVICLAIPDRRFTFDLRRAESTTGEMVEAYLLRVRRPPARHLFDQVSLQAAFPKAQGWEDDMFVQSPVLEKHLPGAAACRARGIDRRLCRCPLLGLYARVVPGCRRPPVAGRPFPLRDRVLPPHGIRRLRVLCQAPQVARSGGDRRLVSERQGPPQELAHGAGLPGNAAGKGLRAELAGVVLSALAARPGRAKKATGRRATPTGSRASLFARLDGRSQEFDVPGG